MAGRARKPKPTTPDDETLILRLYGTPRDLSTTDIRLVTDFTGAEISRVLDKYHFPRRNNPYSPIALLQRETSRGRRRKSVS